MIMMVHTYLIPGIVIEVSATLVAMTIILWPERRVRRKKSGRRWNEEIMWEEVNEGKNKEWGFKKEVGSTIGKVEVRWSLNEMRKVISDANSHKIVCTNKWVSTRTDGHRSVHGQTDTPFGASLNTLLCCSAVIIANKGNTRTWGQLPPIPCELSSLLLPLSLHLIKCPFNNSHQQLTHTSFPDMW